MLQEYPFSPTGAHPEVLLPKVDAVMVGLARQNKNGELELFVTTTTLNGEEILTFPGGKVENETPEEAAMRELYEEVGVKELKDLQFVAFADLPPRDGKTKMRVMGFVTTRWTGTPHSKKPEEVTLSGFMTREKVAYYMDKLHQNNKDMLDAFDLVKQMVQTKVITFPPEVPVHATTFPNDVPIVD